MKTYDTFNRNSTKALEYFPNHSYDRLAILDKTLLKRLIKTWVDNRNDDNSHYYIPINSPLPFALHLKIAQNVLFIMFCLPILYNFDLFSVAFSFYYHRHLFEA